MNYLSLIGRSDVLFSPDISGNEEVLRKTIGRSRFLIIGGSGSIGQAVAREVFRRDPQVLHVVDDAGAQVEPVEQCARRVIHHCTLTAHDG